MHFHIRHRLLVVLPVVLAVIWLTARASVPVRGALIVGGNVVRTIAEDEGSVLLSGKGLIEAEAGPFHLLGWSGGFTVLVQDESVTVAAITTPVVVRDDADRRLIVPVRSQWNGSSIPEEPVTALTMLRSVPPSYTERQLRNIPAGAPGEEPVAEPSLLAAFADTWNVLRLPRAEERAHEEQEDAILSSFTAKLQSGDRTGAVSFLQKGAVAGVLSALPADRLLALFPAAAKQGLTQWFLPVFVADADRWLLASLHPMLREHAWTMPSLDHTTSREERLLRLLLLVHGDVLPEGPSDRVIERWGEELHQFLKASDDPSALLSGILPQLENGIAESSERGYPHRARRYAAALLAAVEPWESSLPHGLQQVVERLRSYERLTPADDLPEGSDVPSSAAAEIPSITQSPPPSMTSEEIRAGTMEALLSIGALFTTRTIIEPIAQRAAARVTDIAFPTPRGDRLFSFTFDAAAGTVSAVSQEGRTLPYAVPLPSFVPWAQSLE